MNRRLALVLLSVTALLSHGVVAQDSTSISTNSTTVPPVETSSPPSTATPSSDTISPATTSPPVVSCEQVGLVSINVLGAASPFCVSSNTCNTNYIGECPGANAVDITGAILPRGSCCAALEGTGEVGCVSLDLLAGDVQCIQHAGSGNSANVLDPKTLTPVPTPTPSTATPLPTSEIPVSDPPVTTSSPPVATSSPPDATSSPPEVTSSPPEVTSSPPVTTSSPPEVTSSPPVTTSSPPEATSSPPEATSSPPEATSSPPEATSSPPEATSSAPEATSSAPEVTSSAPEATSSAPEATSSSPEVTSSPPEATSSPPEATSSPPEATSSPPEATSSPPEATSSPPEVTSSPPEATTVTPSPSNSTATPSLFNSTLPPIQFPTKITSSLSTSSAGSGGGAVETREPEAGDEVPAVSAPSSTSAPPGVVWDLSSLEPITEAPSTSAQSNSIVGGTANSNSNGKGESNSGGSATSRSGGSFGVLNSNVLLTVLIGSVATVAIIIGAFILRRRPGSSPTGSSTTAGSLFSRKLHGSDAAPLTLDGDEDLYEDLSFRVTDAFSPIHVLPGLSYAESNTPSNDRPSYFL